MLLRCVRLLFRALTVFYFVSYFVLYCDGQSIRIKNKNYFESPTTPLPFPPCKADDIDCLRKGLRTFFFLMNAGYMGMKAVDPIELNSLSVSLPENQLSFFLRRVNVSGVKWTKLAARKFYMDNGKNSVRFISDLHVNGEITMTTAERFDPYFAYLTMDINEVESNITYAWSGERGVDTEDYILLGPERTVVRNSRTPSFFMQPGDNEDSFTITQTLKARPSILEHLSNEITSAVMDAVVENFRRFARRVPVKHFYTYTVE